MATLLNGVTSDTTGTGASHSGPCTVWVSGDLKGGQVIVQAAATDTAADYFVVDNTSMKDPATFTSPGNATINAYGTYYLRAKLIGAGSGASVTVVTSQ